MSVFKSTFSRALSVIKSENANIPYPSIAQTGVNTSVAGTNRLIDSSAKFITNNIAAGDIVYCISNSTAATVVSVVSQTELILNADIFYTSFNNYTIYVASSQTTIGNAGCFLYVGGAGNIVCDTIGEDNNIAFVSVTAGTILPVQVKKLRMGTTATDIIALW